MGIVLGKRFLVDANNRAVSPLSINSYTKSKRTWYFLLIICGLTVPVDTYHQKDREVWATSG